MADVVIWIQTFVVAAALVGPLATLAVLAVLDLREVKLLRSSLRV